ncbi:MAG: ABC transporter permease [Spirochaetes bacterium]|nr:ABC transporter permease [Spirochaetota bacterium]
MKTIKYIGVARKSLLDHKMRSFLTILGIIFGVAAVIAMMSIGEGAKREALAQIQELGINNMFIDDKPEERKNAAEQGRYFSDGLAEGDLAFLRATLPFISAASRLLKLDGFVQSEGYQNNVQILGTEPAYGDVLTVDLERGRFLHPQDLAESRSVCVLSGPLYRKIYRDDVAEGAAAPSGQAADRWLRLNNRYFKVVGVVKARSGTVDTVFIPLNHPVLRETFRAFAAPLSGLILRIDDTAYISRSVPMIRKILLRRHFSIEDFSLTVPELLLKQQEKTKNLFNLVMILITSISLLVGGIGIMNIMLASVMERTREIGIRRALGATQRDIRMQFLIESIMLCLAGGLIGIVTGILLTKGIELMTGWKTYMPVSSFIVSFSVSVFIGVVFGYYPAKNASELDPIEALRHE